MDVFSKLPDEINHLVSEFISKPVVGSLDSFGISQYTFWLIVSSIVLLVLMFTYVKRLSLVPHGIFSNGMEWIVQFIQKDMGTQILGETWKKHFPFIATLFMFILVNNVVGIIPGMKPGSGTISTTAALALVSFVYFVGVGMKNHGVGGYLMSLAPKGVGFPLNILIWLIEVISTLLRPITLAVRLFCNMFAGHIVLGSFALAVSLFAEPLIEQFSVLNSLGLIGSLCFGLILLVVYAIEMFVACIQAYVFAVLTAVYIQGAEAEGH